MSLCMLAASTCYTGNTWAQTGSQVSKVADDKGKAEGTTFTRLLEDRDKQPVGFQTAIVKYVSPKKTGIEVDLVSVVHVGDKAYYASLNKAFEEYDVVLYELVAPPDRAVPKPGRTSSNPIAQLQTMITQVLELESQLEEVDYTAKNFVHADLSPEGMAKVMKDRGEDSLTLTLGIMADVLREMNKQQNKPKGNKMPVEDLDPVALLLDPNRSSTLKSVMARQLQMSANEEMALGKTAHTILVEDRNKAAMEVFKKQLAKGKKKIAIFYGAAHMKDFERRLKDEYGLKKDSTKWLTAWSMTPKKKGSGFEKLLLPLLR